MARRCIYTDCPQGSEKADAFFQFLETWPSQSNDARERANYFSFLFFLHLLRYEFSCASSLGIYHLYFPSSLLPPVQLLRRVLKQSVAMSRRRSAVA